MESEAKSNAENDGWESIRRRILGAAIPTPVAMCSSAKPEPKSPLPSPKEVREEMRPIF